MMTINDIQNAIDAVLVDSELTLAPCADGTMPFRRWGRGQREILVLAHGGSGSWTHWIRNIPYLSERFDLLVPDLPGLGDAAALPQGYTAEDAAGFLGNGIRGVIGGARYHLVGFSWGCTLASLVAAEHHDQLKSLMLIGPAALGEMPRRSNMQALIKRTPDMSAEQVAAANRENLARLMIHDRDRIDELAVYLQTWNTHRARFNSPQFALSTRVLDSLKSVTVPLSVLYGEFDAPAYPNFEAREARLKEVCPGLEFDIIPGAGHWLQYELADVFNARCEAWVKAKAD
ncbi:MAG: alpha/beta hydrolase [Pseudomonadales bacterium]